MSDRKSSQMTTDRYEPFVSSGPMTNNVFCEFSLDSAGSSSSTTNDNETRTDLYDQALNTLPSMDLVLPPPGADQPYSSPFVTPDDDLPSSGVVASASQNSNLDAWCYDASNVQVSLKYDDSSDQFVMEASYKNTLQGTQTDCEAFPLSPGTPDTASTLSVNGIAGPAADFSADTPTGSAAPTPFLTVTWAGIAESQAGTSPPDCSMAAGTTCIITVVNNHIDIYDKAGAELSGQSLNAFFNVSTSNFVFDPRVTWDQYHGRFIVVADDQTGSNSVLHVAVSKDGNPLDGWWRYDFNVKIGNNWLDQPNVGLDATTLYINGNYYDLTTNNFIESRLFAVDMNGLDAGQAVTPWNYADSFLKAPASDIFQYVPAHMYGSESGLTGNFLVSYQQNNAGNDTLNIIRVSNAASGTGSVTSNIQSLNVGNISDANPSGARQPGTSKLIDDGDERVENVVWRDNKLYAVTEIRVGSGASAHDVVHWFVVDTSNLNSLTLLSQGQADFGSNYDSYYGNMTVDNAGNMIIGFSWSGPAVFASSAFAVIPAGGTNLPDGGRNLANGQGTYTGFTDENGTNYRWGDYSGIALDPSFDGSFWVFNEYATNQTTPNNWATTIGGFQVDTTPPSLVNDRPLTVAVGGTATITPQLLSYTDVDNGHAALTYTIVSSPSHGTLLKNGSATSFFTQGDIDQGIIAYHEDGTFTGSDSFAFSVSDPDGHPTAKTQFNISVISAQTIQNDFQAITRTALPADQATTVVNSIVAGTLTETQYVNGLISQVANTTIPAVAVEALMYGVTGSSAEITKLVTQYLPGQIAFAIQNGFNPQVVATEALGYVFAFGDENGGIAFANKYGPSVAGMPNSAAGDAAFASAAATAIFGSAATASTPGAIQTYVSNWKAFFTAFGVIGIAHATPDQIDLAARGTAWGDAVGVALNNNLGPLLGQVVNFLKDAARGTAVYGASLANQPGPAAFQGGSSGEAIAGPSDAAPTTQLVGVADHPDWGLH